MSRPRLGLCLLVTWGAVLLLVVLSTLHARTLRPWSDEGFFAAPAWDLLHNGQMGTTTLEESPEWHGVREHTYYMVPLYLLAQVPWYALWGLTLHSMRAFSLGWALVAFASLWIVMDRLGATSSARALGTALICTDYLFVSASSYGRMDMMSAALGFAGLAVFLAVRERHLLWAIIGSQTLAAAAAFSHPMGAVHVAGLALVTLYLDAPRIRAWHVFPAAAPYLVGITGFAVYVARDPAAFSAQMTWNATYMGRLQGLRNPLLGFSRELTLRYGRAFGLGGHSAGSSGPIYLKAIVLAGLVLGVIAFLAHPRLRSDRLLRLLPIMLALYFVLITFLDNTKGTYYLVHILPLAGAMLAIAAAAWAKSGTMPACLAGTVLAAVLLVNVGGMAYKIRLNSYARRYQPAVDFIQAHAKPGETVFASSAFAFDLGFDQTRLIDDFRLGYDSGKQAEYIIADEIYRDNFEGHRLHRPKIALFVDHKLATVYQVVYDREEIQIYRRAGSGERAPATPPRPVVGAIVDQPR